MYKGFVVTGKGAEHISELELKEFKCKNIVKADSIVKFEFQKYDDLIGRKPVLNAQGWFREK